VAITTGKTTTEADETRSATLDGGEWSGWTVAVAVAVDDRVVLLGTIDRTPRAIDPGAWHVRADDWLPDSHHDRELSIDDLPPISDEGALRTS